MNEQLVNVPVCSNIASLAFILDRVQANISWTRSRHWSHITDYEQ